ncbi:unnamed protein product [Urochloa humidicola]
MGVVRHLHIKVFLSSFSIWSFACFSEIVEEIDHYVCYLTESA